MSSSGATLHRVRWRSPQVAVLLVAAAAAWLATVAWARGMGAMPGMMGSGLAEFVPTWTLMMAAMMLPAVTPLASMYARSLRTHRAPRLVEFTGGYLLIWAAVGLPAYGCAWLAGWLATHHPAAATVMAVAAFTAGGLYQLTPLKARCLRRCRTPVAQLLHYGNYRGRLRDLRVGVHHGAYCLGCCWALMLVLVAFGVMNLPAMLILAALITIEKLWRHGEAVGRLAAVSLLAFAIAVWWHPGLAPGLHMSAM